MWNLQYVGSRRSLRWRKWFEPEATMGPRRCTTDLGEALVHICSASEGRREAYYLPQRLFAKMSNRIPDLVTGWPDRRRWRPRSGPDRVVWTPLRPPGGCACWRTQPVLPRCGRGLAQQGRSGDTARRDDVVSGGEAVCAQRPGGVWARQRTVGLLLFNGGLE